MSTSGRMPRWVFARGRAALAQPSAVPVSLAPAAAAAGWARNPIMAHAALGSALRAGGELDVMPTEVPEATGAATTRPSSVGCNYCHPGEDSV